MKKIFNFLMRYSFFSKLYGVVMCIRIFLYDSSRVLKYSVFANNQHTALAKIIMDYHVVEKGIAMPNRRDGFSQKNIFNLIDLIEIYIEKYGKSENQIIAAISVINEYKEIHKGKEEIFSECFKTKLLNFCEKYKEYSSLRQIEITREEYFGNNLVSEFNVFSRSRHSVRNMEGEVAVQDVVKSIELASNAPSACNRQYCKAHLFVNKDDIAKILALQNGNRGFGQLTDKLIVITSNVNYIGAYERNDLYTNAGIFIMNLLYCLHRNKIASCVLNWSVSPQRDRKLRKITGIPLRESIVAIIILGDVPERFMLTASKRKSINEYLEIH